MITIIDYGLGNLGSIENMLKYLQINYVTSGERDEISRAEKILLPGVGSYDSAMSKLNEKGFSDIIREKVLKEGVPILGICLGMQLLFNKSTEGQIDGLGLIKGHVTKFNLKDEKLKTPHMGWNSVNLKQNSLYVKDFQNENIRFYFVHSYYAKVDNQEDEWMTTNYGHDFCSAVRRGSILGVQFHPEKSHKYGMTIFKEFNEI